MQAFKKVLMAIAALGALAFGGAQIAGAAGGSNGSSNTATESQDGEHQDGDLTGPAADKASAAAVKANGGGTVESVEKADEGKAVYEVKVNKAGTITEITLGSDYSVVSQQADDDQGHHDQGDGDGDGEQQDDAAGQR